MTENAISDISCTMNISYRVLARRRFLHRPYEARINGFSVVCKVMEESENAVPESEQLQNVDVLGGGVSSLLATVLKDFDSGAQATVNSQDQLSSAIDRHARELDQLLETAPLPFIMQHAVKISTVRKRVLSLNSLLKSIQRRVGTIDRMLFAEKTTDESHIQH